jgi:hypothetical protein
MNTFIGIGKIVDFDLNGKILKFDLVIQQPKPCNVPCVLFEPNDEVKGFIKHYQNTGQTVWLQGKVASYEFENYGRKVQKVNIVTFPKSIKPI